MLAGIEFTGDSLRPAARTRFGIDVAPTLVALGGKQALSQPLLFEPGVAESLRVGADEAIRRMYGTTTFAKTAALGVYWEAYGFTASDTVEINVRALREDRPGVVARAGAAATPGQGGSRFLVEALDTLGMAPAMVRRAALLLAIGFLVVVPGTWLLDRRKRQRAAAHDTGTVHDPRQGASPRGRGYRR